MLTPSRNCTFMIETAEAIMSTLDAILDSLREDGSPALSQSTKSAIRAITYRKRTFKSTLLRVYSLERRSQSSIQVYQALVTQADSHAMKFIAVLTLIFLPITGVSTIFSSPFFDVDFDKESSSLRVARCFWKFWAVVAPLTLGIGLLCYFWFQFPHFFRDLFSFLSELGSKNFWTRMLGNRRAHSKQQKPGGV